MRGSRAAPPPAAGGILGLAPPTAMMHSMPPPQQSMPVQSSRSAARDPRAQRRDEMLIAFMEQNGIPYSS